MKPLSLALRIALFSAVLALVVVAFSATSGSRPVPEPAKVEAAHVDPILLSEPRLWYRFFNAVGGSHEVKWALCDFLPFFGFGPNAVAAQADWENTHGFGIEFVQTGSCFGGWGLSFKTIFGNECGVPPPGFIFGGCWVPEYWVNYTGLLAATRVTIYYNTLWYDAFANSAQKTHNFAHEMGHGMGVAHHTNCATVMSQGLCTNGVETSDVWWPRCLYGYSC